MTSDEPEVYSMKGIKGWFVFQGTELNKMMNAVQWHHSLLIM